MERQAPRRLRVLIVLALGVLAALAPGRTFKNTEGKTIEAEIARATATTVTLRLRNERTATIPLSTLSKPDQAYVKEWLADRVPRLRFDPRVKRSNKDADYTSSYSGRTYRTYSRQMQTYETSVEVRCEETAKGLDESTMTYLLIGRSLSNANQYKILTVQTEDFSIEPGGTAVVPFRTVVNYYYDSNYSRSGYKCVGYVFFAHRNRDHREIYSHGSTNSLRMAAPLLRKLEAGDVLDNNFRRISPARREKSDEEGPLIVR